MFRTLVLALSLVAAAHPALAVTPGRSPGDRPLVVEIRVEPPEARAGRPVTFVWRVRDPDPLTELERALIEHGDGTATSVEDGRAFGPCPEVASAAGLDHEFRTHHVFERPGRYEVRAGVLARRSLCAVPLKPPERAETSFSLEVG